MINKIRCWFMGHSYVPVFECADMRIPKKNKWSHREYRCTCDRCGAKTEWIRRAGLEAWRTKNNCYW